jgi:hypothetical protein
MKLFNGAEYDRNGTLCGINMQTVRRNTEGTYM